MSRQLPSAPRLSADDNTSLRTGSRLTNVQLHQQINQLRVTMKEVRTDVENQFHFQQEIRTLIEQRFNDQQSLFQQQMNSLVNAIQNLKSNNAITIVDNNGIDNNSIYDVLENNNSNRNFLAPPEAQPTSAQQINPNQSSLFNQILKPSKPERFSGDPEQVDPFIQQVELNFSYYKVAEEQQTKLASAWLNGAAMRWYLFMKSRDPNFEMLNGMILKYHYPNNLKFKTKNKLLVINCII